MFFTLQKIKTKGVKIPDSIAKKNCYIREHFKIDNYTLRIIEGETIKRKAKTDAWKLIVSHSYRKNGKVEKKQKYITTLHYWRIVNSYMIKIRDDTDLWGYDFDDSDFPITWFIDLEMIFDAVASFEIPYFYEKIEISLIEKVKPLVSKIIKEFKKTTEYKYFTDFIIMTERINRLKKNEDRQNSGYDYNQFHNRFNQSTGNIYNGSNQNSIEITKDEAKIILDCYKAMSTKLHPDIGGSDEDMKILNGLKEKCQKCR